MTPGKRQIPYQETLETASFGEGPEKMDAVKKKKTEKKGGGRGLRPIVGKEGTNTFPHENKTIGDHREVKPRPRKRWKGGIRSRRSTSEGGGISRRI